MDQYKKNKQKSIICWVIAFALAIFYLIVSVMPFVFNGLCHLASGYAFFKLTASFIGFVAPLVVNTTKCFPVKFKASSRVRTTLGAPPHQIGK